MAKLKIKDIVTDVVASFLEENKLELYNVEFLKEGKDWFLRIYIDKAQNAEEQYISSDDCEMVSRFLNEELDKLDPIEQNYYLEVSSPGMDRELLEQKHFDRYVGELVEVSLYKPINGKKKLEGELIGLADKIITIKIEEEELNLPQDEVAKVRLVVVF